MWSNVMSKLCSGRIHTFLSEGAFCSGGLRPGEGVYQGYSPAMSWGLADQNTLFTIWEVIRSRENACSAFGTVQQFESIESMWSQL